MCLIQRKLHLKIVEIVCIPFLFHFSDFKNEDIIFINGVDFMQQQHCFSDQLKFCYEFHDPMDLWMDWDFQGVSYVAILGIQTSSWSKYKMLIRFLLQMSYSFYIFLFNCMQPRSRVQLISYMLAWLHYKSDYTLSRRVHMIKVWVWWISSLSSIYFSDYFGVK
jgi:hypothetical protein